MALTLNELILLPDNPSIQGTYWTSGSFLDCDDKYGWCSLEGFFNSTVKWGAGQPPSTKANTCVKVYLGGAGEDSYLTATDCDGQANYICEV
jgi:hypothetical protein